MSLCVTFSGVDSLSLPVQRRHFNCADAGFFFANVVEERDLQANWRCKCTKRASGRFLNQASSAQCGWCSLAVVSALHLSPDQCSLILGVGNRATRALFFRLLMPILHQPFSVCLIACACGGRRFDVELDEICFRSVARAHGVV